MTTPRLRPRPILAAAAGVLAIPALAGPVFACGGLIGRNGSVNLEQTTTLAAYHDGVEHYVTAFTFGGGSATGDGAPGGDTTAEVGSIVPLPGVPTNVEKGGSWTLQRLEREVRPPEAAFGVRALAAQAADVEELAKVRIDALDVTVLRGGGAAVGRWAGEHGFLLPPDAPEVLDFYAARSPIFLAARFDAAAARARGSVAGDGTPVHLTIPTANPWVPLRILTLGQAPSAPVNADVFLLTDRTPALLPAPDAPAGTPGSALHVARSEPASARLLADLRADAGMDWVPEGMQLTFVRVSGTAGSLHHDLALDVSGRGEPSPRLAGLKLTPAANVLPRPAPGRRPGLGAAAGIALAGLASLLAASAAVAVMIRLRLRLRLRTGRS